MLRSLHFSCAGPPLPPSPLADAASLALASFLRPCSLSRSYSAPASLTSRMRSPTPTPAAAMARPTGPPAAKPDATDAAAPDRCPLEGLSAEAVARRDARRGIPAKPAPASPAAFASCFTCLREALVEHCLAALSRLVETSSRLLTGLLSGLAHVRQGLGCQSPWSS